MSGFIRLGFKIQFNSAANFPWLTEVTLLLFK